jgi:hypothetical protein
MSGRIRLIDAPDPASRGRTRRALTPPILKSSPRARRNLRDRLARTRGAMHQVVNVPLPKRVCRPHGPNQYSLEIHIQEWSRSPATRSCKDPGTPSAAESDTWPYLVDARGSRTGGGREWQPCAVVRRVVPGFAWARGLDQVAMVGLEWVDWFNHRRLHSAVRAFHLPSTDSSTTVEQRPRQRRGTPDSPPNPGWFSRRDPRCPGAGA